MTPHPQDYIVDQANAGRRVDALVRKLCDEVPLGTLMKWLRKGQVRLNARRCAPAARVAAGDVVRLPAAVASLGGSDGNIDAPLKRVRRPRLPPVAVAYEDEHLLVADKAAHLACHPGTGLGDDSLAARVLQHLNAHAAPVGHRPGLAQRLDRGVSGLVPIGKHAAALRQLAAHGAAHTLEKTYLALVWGNIVRDRGIIDIPLRVGDQPMGDRPRVVADASGKPAVTLYQVVRRFADSTLVALRLRTGRTHQIRAHLYALGHPLWGDPRYGDAERNVYLHRTLGLNRPFLHAAELQMPHPMTQQALSFTAALPADLVRALGACRPLWRTTAPLMNLGPWPHWHGAGSRDVAGKTL
jgi:RluA family pseudouridine synthase